MTGNAERACPDADLRSLGIVQLIVRIENIYVMPVFFFYAFSVKNTLTLTAGRLQIRNFSAEVRLVCRAKLCHRRKRTDFNRPVGSGMVALQFLCAVMCLRCVCSLLLFRLFLCFMLRQSRFCFRGSGRIQQSQKRFEAGGGYINFFGTGFAINRTVIQAASCCVIVPSPNLLCLTRFPMKLTVRTSIL